jgi:hypothetical protein
MGGVAVLASAVLSGIHGVAASARVPSNDAGTAEVHAPAASSRHHYVMNARVRPFLLFWIGRSNVGDAIVTRVTGQDETLYSLLIGSDPDRAPRRINRWGYIEERIRGDAASVVGLMTESDEESVAEAEANLRKEASGLHTFTVIHAAIDAGQSRSVVTAIGAPADYSFRQARAVLELAREAAPGRSRVVRMPTGTRPGFLSAIAEMIHGQAESARAGHLRAGVPLTYVYHGKFYELRSTDVQLKPMLDVNSSRHGPAVSAQFTIAGKLAEVPLAMSYQPRWWMQVNLVLADDVALPPVDPVES